MPEGLRSACEHRNLPKNSGTDTTLRWCKTSFGFCAFQLYRCEPTIIVHSFHVRPIGLMCCENECIGFTMICVFSFLASLRGRFQTDGGFRWEIMSGWYLSGSNFYEFFKSVLNNWENNKSLQLRSVTGLFGEWVFMNKIAIFETK